MTATERFGVPPEVAASTSLIAAVRTAERLRDVQGNDDGAARELDRALRGAAGARPQEHAYALLVRMELAERLGQREQLARLRRGFERITLNPFEREQLERWLAVATPHDRPAAHAPAGTPPTGRPPSVEETTRGCPP